MFLWGLMLDTFMILSKIPAKLSITLQCLHINIFPHFFLLHLKFNIIVWVNKLYAHKSLLKIMVLLSMIKFYITNFISNRKETDPMKHCWKDTSLVFLTAESHSCFLLKVQAFFWKSKYLDIGFPYIFFLIFWKTI